MTGLAQCMLVFFGVAAFSAYDAWRRADRKRLVASILIAIPMLLVAIYVVLYVPDPPGGLPNRLQRGFGPDWDCSSNLVCVRKPYGQ
jgi:hypothetical protein